MRLQELVLKPKRGIVSIGIYKNLGRSHRTLPPLPPLAITSQDSRRGWSK